MLQGYWTNEFGPSAGGDYADKSYWICTEIWASQNYPIDQDLYENQLGFANGYSPLFIVVGFNNVVYYHDNYVTPVRQAVMDAINSFPTDGVYVSHPNPDKTLAPSEVLNLDISNVFGDFEGDDLTITLESNSNPSKATVVLAGLNLIITASTTEYSGSTTIIIKGEDVANGEFNTDMFVVNVVGNEWTGASVSPLNVDISIPVDSTTEEIVTITAGVIPAVLNFESETKFISKKPVSEKFTWDEQFAYDLEAIAGVGDLVGCETDGNFIYTTNWSNSDILKFGMDGTYMETFQIPTVTGLRDLAYDGEFFYGGISTNYIYKMDFTAKTLVETITSPTSVRAIAYDEANDAFWVNSWSQDFRLVNRMGATLLTITDIPSCYGAAYDNFSPGGPYLWLNAGTPSTGYPATAVQISLATGDFTGVEQQIAVTEYSGGMFIHPNIVLGTVTMGVLAQGEKLYGVELCQIGGWVTLSNASGAVSAGNTHDITLSFDSTGFPLGTVKTAALNFIDENGFEYTNSLNVTMTITDVVYPPDTPTNVATSLFGPSLIIDWDVSADATSYDVYSSDDPYGTFTLATNVGTNQYTVPASQAKLFYYIVAKN